MNEKKWINSCSKLQSNVDVIIPSPLILSEFLLPFLLQSSEELVQKQTPQSDVCCGHLIFLQLRAQMPKDTMSVSQRYWGFDKMGAHDGLGIKTCWQFHFDQLSLFYYIQSQCILFFTRFYWCVCMCDWECSKSLPLL